MGIVKFGDVVERINIKVDQSNPQLNYMEHGRRIIIPIKYYVGGEHIEGSEFMVHKKALIQGSTIGYQFQFGFRKGDILFMTKNPHLRKASMVDFDGLCSIATFVIASKSNNLLQNYLLLEMQSDRFWQYCEDNKSGGVNYFINWGTLSNYEFDLPPIEKQKELADKLWAAYRLKEGYKRLFAAIDEMVKSQFIEMYHKTHNTQTLESVCAIISKGITPKYVDFSSVAVVNQACIQWDGLHLENIKYHNEEILFKKRTLQTGDVLLNATGTGTLGRCCVFNCPSNDNIYINDGHVIALATNKSILLPEVLNAYLSLNDTQAEIYRLYVTGSTNQVDIVFSDIKKMKVPVPNIDDQISFVKILNQVDKSKFGDFKSQFIEMYHKTHNTQTLESVCAIISKGITPKYVDFSSVAVVNQACIQWDGLHLENIKYHNEEILFKKRTLQTGDVLLNATGTGTLGRCCVFNCPSNDNIYINDGHVIALATNKSILLPEVLNAYLSLNDTQAEIYRLYVTGSTNQVDIVFSDIKKMKVPVPNIDDQISFVKILNQVDKSKSYVLIAFKNLESMLRYCIGKIA